MLREIVTVLAPEPTDWYGVMEMFGITTAATNHCPKFAPLGLTTEDEEDDSVPVTTVYPPLEL